MGKHEALLRVERVTKSYGEHVAVDHVSFDVESGEVVSIIGPSGSGKSTLLRCINFLEEFQDGAIEVDGKDVGYETSGGTRKRLPESVIASHRAAVGMVFQGFNLFSHKTVLQNVTLGPTLVKHIRRRDAESEALRLLASVGLSGKENEYPASLSGGQRQRVGIARALAMKPRVLLFDEVTSALDPELVDEVLDVMSKLASDGTTMIIVTHEMQFAYDVSDKILFFEGGQILAKGTPVEMFDNQDNERIQRFLRRFHVRTEAAG